jgi:hypothetical protein
METKIISNMIRIDKGTETGIMSTMHAFLRRNHGDRSDMHYHFCMHAVICAHA